MTKLKINKDEVTVEEGEDSLAGKLIAGCKGKVRVKTPFGEREIKTVKNASGKIIKKPKKTR